MNNTFTESIIIDQSIITFAVEHLRSGNLVAFPTETVYGLGADAANEVALKKLYAVKGRPSAHPVIIHLANAEQMRDWGIDLSDYAKKLASHFWPGPLTLIVKKSPRVSSLITGGQDTIGLRVPNHPIALALLKEFGGGVAAPSANKYGHVSATCAQHVRDEFDDQIRLVIDGGNCPVGIESTIVDTTGKTPRILRPGMISEQEILKCLELDKLETNGQNIRVPGSDKTHYAPQTPVLLLDHQAIQTTLNEAKNGKSFAILALTKPNTADHPIAKGIVRQYIQASEDPKLYAQDLYRNLRQLDSTDASIILVEKVPQSADWLPIADRLQRASSS